MKQAKLTDLSYLIHERKLSEETLSKFLSSIKLVRKSDQSFINIGFPYSKPGEGRIQGYELVNFHFKGHATGSQRKSAVWLADLSKVPQLANQVYIAESAVDAMSFHQLYRDKYLFDQAVFISTGGNGLRNQAQQIFKAFPKAKINTLFDYDFSGKMYDIFLASIKANREVVMVKNKDSVSFEINKGSFEIPTDQLSLAKFERLTGIRSGVRVHKSKGKDFNEMLQNRSKEIPQKSRLKRT